MIILICNIVIIAITTVTSIDTITITTTTTNRLRNDQISREIAITPTMMNAFEPLTDGDINKANNLLKSPRLLNLPNYRKVIQDMLIFKCDLEILFIHDIDYLSTFVERALLTGDMI